MIEKFDHLQEQSMRNSENVGEILVAIAILREQIASKTVLVEEYNLDDFSVNSYLPFMNFLQNREYVSIRRFLLIHPTPVFGSQWSSGGNGVRPSEEMS